VRRTTTAGMESLSTWARLGAARCRLTGAEVSKVIITLKFVFLFNLDWSQASFSSLSKRSQVERGRSRPHQPAAMAEVVAGLITSALVQIASDKLSTAIAEQACLVCNFGKDLEGMNGVHGGCAGGRGAAVS
jgi:hypothetical protein